MLKLHSRGAQVETLQKLLNKAGASPHLVVDGDFGPRTDHAVKHFQAHHKDWSGKRLVVDGEVGERTWWSLQRATGHKPPKPHPGGGGPSGGPTGGSVGHRIVRIGLREAERGVHEVGGANTGADVRKYQHSTGLGGSGWPWCAAFVTWVYERAGLVLSTSAGFASVYYMEQWGRNTGRWHTRYQGYVAPPGAIVIYTFSHTGIVVTGRSSGYDTTVEGNTSAGGSGSQNNGDGVYRKTRSHSLIKGYVVMNQILKG